VYTWLRRFQANGYTGLENRSSANIRRVRKVDELLKAKARRLLDATDIGAFRLWSALRRDGYHISERTCSRLIEENRQLYQIPKLPGEQRPTKEMPFKAERRHEYVIGIVRKRSTLGYRG
jgi:hypothetical protein